MQLVWTYITRARDKFRFALTSIRLFFFSNIVFIVFKSCNTYLYVLCIYILYCSNDVVGRVTSAVGYIFFSVYIRH